MAENGESVTIVEVLERLRQHLLDDWGKGDRFGHFLTSRAMQIVRGVTVPYVPAAGSTDLRLGPTQEQISEATREYAKNYGLDDLLKRSDSYSVLWAVQNEIEVEKRAEEAAADTEFPLLVGADDAPPEPAPRAPLPRPSEALARFQEARVPIQQEIPLTPGEEDVRGLAGTGRVGQTLFGPLGQSVQLLIDRIDSYIEEDAIEADAQTILDIRVELGRALTWAEFGQANSFYYGGDEELTENKAEELVLAQSPGAEGDQVKARVDMFMRLGPEALQMERFEPGSAENDYLTYQHLSVLGHRLTYQIAKNRTDLVRETKEAAEKDRAVADALTAKVNADNAASFAVEDLLRIKAQAAAALSAKEYNDLQIEYLEADRTAQIALATQNAENAVAEAALLAEQLAGAVQSREHALELQPSTVAFSTARAGIAEADLAIASINLTVSEDTQDAAVQKILDEAGITASRLRVAVGTEEPAIARIERENQVDIPGDHFALVRERSTHAGGYGSADTAKLAADFDQQLRIHQLVTVNSRFSPTHREVVDFFLSTTPGYQGGRLQVSDSLYNRMLQRTRTVLGTGGDLGAQETRPVQAPTAARPVQASTAARPVRATQATVDEVTRRILAQQAANPARPFM